MCGVRLKIVCLQGFRGLLIGAVCFMCLLATLGSPSQLKAARSYYSQGRLACSCCGGGPPNTVSELVSSCSLAVCWLWRMLLLSFHCRCRCRLPSYVRRCLVGAVCVRCMASSTSTTNSVTRCVFCGLMLSVDAVE